MPHTRALPRRRPGHARAAAGTLAGVLVVAALSACSADGERAPESRGDAATSVAQAIEDDPELARLPRVLARTVVREPRRPGSPRGVVTALVAAEAAIDNRGTAPRVLRAAGHLEQVAYRALGAAPDWDRRVRALLPDELKPRVDANVAARREFRALQGDRLGDTLPAWRIVRPVPARRLRSFYAEAERRFGVDWEYLAAINLVETGMGRIRGTSVAGAQGPMQFIPATWEIYGRGDISDPRDAILAAGRYLSARGFSDPGGVPGALYSYNNSSRYVRAVTAIAEQMVARPRAYLGYYHWRIYYRTVRGDVRLPVGYSRAEPVAVERWLRDNPRERLVE